MPEASSIGPRDVERQAVLVDREAREFRIHHLARRRHRLLQAAAPGDRDLGGAVERGDEIARHRDRLAHGRRALQRVAATRRDRLRIEGAGSRSASPAIRADARRRNSRPSDIRSGRPRASPRHPAPRRRCRPTYVRRRAASGAPRACRDGSSSRRRRSSVGQVRPGMLSASWNRRGKRPYSESQSCWPRSGDQAMGLLRGDDRLGA